MSLCSARGLAAALLSLSRTAVGWSQSPYVLGVHTDTGNDTLMQGRPGALIFSVDAWSGVPAAAITWAVTLDFSNEVGLGPAVDSFWQVTHPSSTVNVFHTKRDGAWAQNIRPRFYTTDPDTLLVGALYYQSTHWQGVGEQWRIVFTPSDTGLIVIDSVPVWPDNHCSVLDLDAQPHPISWQPRTIRIVPFCASGDVNGDTSLTSSDAIYLINYVFKNGPEPLGCTALGDVNCSGTVTSGDIIQFLNHIFRGGPQPCYTCALVVQGVWTCP